MAILTYSVAIYFLLFASALALSAYLYVTRNFNHWKKKKVPFVKPLPFFGSYKDVILRKRCVAHFVKDTYANNKGRFVGVYLIDAPALIIRDPELIRTILIKDFNHFVNRAVAQNMKADPIGSSVLFSLRYRQWRPLRHEMVTAFTAAKMKQMFTLMAVSAESMREYLSKASPAELQTKDLAMKYTVDVMASCAFGTEAETFRSEEATFWAMVKRLFDYSSFKISFSLNCYFVAPLLVKALHLKFMEPVATEFLRSLTLRIIEERVGSGKSRGDLVDILVRIQKSKPWIPEHQLVAQSVQFVAAGYETTSSALTFLLYELASDQALQERLRADIKAALPSDGSLTFESLKDMKYLDCCFKETLRKYPPVPILSRECKEPYKIPGSDVTLDKGTHVMFPVMGFHHDPTYFPKPEQFNPDRFLDHSKQNDSVYMPFGHGPRNCIGARFGELSAKVALASLIPNFKVEMCEESKKVDFDPVAFTLHPLDGMKLRYTKIG